MNADKPEPAPAAESWDNYWHGERHGAAFTGGGTSHPLVLSFWSEFFGAVRGLYDAPNIIDIASGNGAVIECAQSVFLEQSKDLTCIDISASAISVLKKRFPGVNGIVADARAIPFRSGSYDIVTSQFGVEYAGLEAIDEAARMVSSGGRLALLMHHKAGGIYRQCKASRDAVIMMQESGFIRDSIDMLEKGFAACRGADPTIYEAAAKKLVPAVKTMESIMRYHGKHVADGTIAGLYNDVKTINSRIQHYEPLEVLRWLEKMQSEVKAFQGRMASMCDAAIDADEFERLCDKLQCGDFELLRNEALTHPEHGIPLAWALVATRS